MPSKQYTLDELITLTGFGKRQIRYYITEKLIPGAGDQRGPNAVYGEETLKRLEIIAVLKDQPVGPTGRTMTLAEIRHTLDNPPESDMMLSMVKEPRAELSDNKMRFQASSDSSASQYLADLEVEPTSDQSLFREQQISAMSCEFEKTDSQTPTPIEEPPLTNLMQSLKSLLTELAADTQFDPQVGEGKSWRRITAPDVEIQVRTPDTIEARLRLHQMAKQLGRMLERED